MSLSSGSVKRPITTIMFYIAIAIMGYISYTRLAIDQLPDITLPSLSIVTMYEGAAPAEIEKLITEPIEKAVSTISKVAEVRSRSNEDRSTVTVDFAWGTDIDQAANDVRDKLGQVRGLLPEDAEEPIIAKWDFGDQPIVYLSLIGPQNPVLLRDIADNQVRYQLEQVEGVAAVDIWGGLEREIHVELERHRLEGAGLSVQDVVRALSLENLTLGGGHLEAGRTDYIVRPMGEFTDLKQLGDVVLRTNHGRQVYLRDVARVEDAYKDTRTRTRVNRGQGVILAIRKQSGGNTVQVADRAMAALPGIRKDLPPGMQLNPMFNRADFIKKSISQVKDSALRGGLIAVIVIFLFLFNIRSTVIIATNIPIAILATFILLYNKDISLNWMSLGGLALAVGILVDNSVVVLENIFRHRAEGANARDASIKGSGEVGIAISASTLTTLCVFLPLIFVKGMVGIVFRELALTVTFSLLASLLVALTLAPMLSAKLMERRASSGKEKDHAAWFKPLQATYKRFLGRVLRRRGLVIALSTAALLVVILGTIFRIGSELLPSVDEGMMYSFVEMPVGTRIGLTDAVLNRMEETALKNVPEARAFFARAGLMWAGMGGGGTHTGFLWIKLTDRSERDRPLTQVMDVLRKEFKEIPDAKIRLIERPSDVSRMLGRGRQERVEVDIVGYDLKKGEALARSISRAIQGVDGVAFARLSVETTRPEMRIDIDRAKAGAMGFNTSEIVNTVKTSVDGTVASRYREGGNEYDIRVRLREEDRQRPEDLGDFFLTTASGKRIALKNLAGYKPALGPVEIGRRGQQRVTTVQAGLKGTRDFGSVMRDIEKEVSKIQASKGLSVKFAGEREEQIKSKKYLLLAGVLALILVYMVMASLYESLLHPFVIMFSIPFSMIGVFLVLFLTGTNFSIPAYMGIIMLIGIVVNNGIVMVDYINRLRKEGMELQEAVMTGASVRLRPVLITTLTTIVALMPMALGLGEGAEMWSPLARVVAAGLAVGTLFTLFFIPALYTAFESLRLRRKAKKQTASLSI